MALPHGSSTLPNLNPISCQHSACHYMVGMVVLVSNTVGIGNILQRR